jgi:hypothetical protein
METEPSKLYDLEALNINRKTNVKDLSKICEYEYLVKSWRDINSLTNYKDIEGKVRELFFPFFYLRKTYFDDVGHYILKFVFVAYETGILLHDEIGIDIEVRERSSYVVGEIKKNNLLYENSNSLQLRVGDVLIFYVTQKKNDNM